MQELFQAVSATLAETSATARPVSLVAIELDRLQTLRSALGESAADQVCGQVSNMLERILRTGDYVKRVTDGELLVVLLGAGAADARSVAQRISAAVRGHPFYPNGSSSASRFDEAPSRVTISAGVAATPDHGIDAETLFSAATRARGVVAQRGGDGVAMAPQPGAAPAPLAPDLARLAGRLEERRTLFKLLEEANSGKPRVVTIVGETGTGTLTLAKQLEPEVRMLGGSIVFGRARATPVRTPYEPWAAVLKAMRRLPAPPDHPWRELPKLVPELAHDVHATAGTRYRLMQEIAEYLRIASRDYPLVVVLDEMQWADEGSWDALDYLVEQLTDERLLICLTMRSGAEHTVAAERCAALQRRANYQEVQLSRLTREDVKRWIEAALDHQEVGREFLAFAYRHTEGNPFLLTQLLRCLAEENALWHSGERWEWKPVSELRLPTGLAGIVAWRLERLSSSTQAVLGTAAIVGREFDVPLVAACGAGSAAAVQLAFDESLAAGILQHVYDRRRKAFAFAHDSIVDVLTQQVPADRLRQLHERVARAMEARGEGSAADLALHHDAAGVSAFAYLSALHAATKAEEIYAPAVAGEFLQVAARNSTSPAQLAEVRVRLAQIADGMGRYDEEEELCDLAIEWFEGQSDPRRTLTLRRMRARARKELGQPAHQSLQALLALDKEAVALGFDRERVAILMLLSQTYGRLGESREAERIAGEGVRMAEQLGDDLLLAEVLNRLGITVMDEAPARAHSCFERALTLYVVRGEARGQISCHLNLGVVAQRESRIDAARESLTTAIALARAAGMRDSWGLGAMNLGVMSQRLGDYDQAHKLFGDAMSLFASVKNSALQLLALFNMAHVERERGEFSSGVELYEATCALAQRIGQSDVEIGARAGEGLCLLAMNRLTDARRPMAQAESRMVTRTEWFQGRELVETLRVLIAVGEGRGSDALERFEQARILADAAGLYSAAWLTAACADALFEIDPGVARAAIERYASKVESVGFVILTERYLALQARM